MENNLKSIKTQHPELSFGQRLLYAGVRPDVLLQAIEEGLLDTVDLNSTVDERPLLERWVQRQGRPPSAADAIISEGFLPDLEWPVGAHPTTLELPESIQKFGSLFWVEHTLIQLVRRGADPLQRWTKSPGSLLEWANETDRPWLLQACLNGLAPSQRLEESRRQLVDEVNGYEEDGVFTHSRLHHALQLSSPAVAQVWLNAGAALDATNSRQETPIFSASNRHTLRWAIDHGADVSSVRWDGVLPVEVWRQNARDAEEWVAMQALSGTSDTQTLGLIRSAIVKADFNGLEKAYERLNNPGATFSDGRTVIEHVAEMILRHNGNRGRDERPRVERSKIMRYLWTRTDFKVLQEHSHPGPLNGLEVAWLGSMLAERVASNAAQQVYKKQRFPQPSLEAVARWSETFFAQDGDMYERHSQAKLRVWVLKEVRERWDKGQLSVDEVTAAMSVLANETNVEVISADEARIACNALLPLFVLARDTNQLSHEQAGKVLTLLLKNMGLGARQELGRNPTATKWNQEAIKEMAEEVQQGSFARNEGLRHLVAFASHLSSLGVRPAEEDVPFLVEHVLDCSMVIHDPDVKPVLPVLKQELLSLVWEQSQTKTARHRL